MVVPTAPSRWLIDQLRHSLQLDGECREKHLDRGLSQTPVTATASPIVVLQLLQLGFNGPSPLVARLDAPR